MENETARIYPEGLDGFNEQMGKKFAKKGSKDFTYRYVRPDDLGPVLTWMKEELDKLKIDEIMFEFKDGKMTYRDIRYCISSPFYENPHSI